MSHLTTHAHFLKARDFAIQEHKKVNQKYGDKPYDFHLHQVHSYVCDFHRCIEETWDWDPDNLNLVKAGAYVHDLLEDTGITYNDLKQATNQEIAEIAFLLQTPKGRNRKERHCDAYYQEMATNREAVYVKVADRIANTQYSLDQGSSMFTKYQQEYPHFQTFLRPAWPELEPMWSHLDHLYCYKPYPTPV